MRKRPIENIFPIVEVNRIAELESTGFGRRHYRPWSVMHKWWARRLGCVFRSILLYSLADDTMTIWDNLKQEYVSAEWNGDSTTLWQFYSQDTQLQHKVILDPMMGGGTTVVEALRFGCKVIAGDINPVAWFVVKKEIEPINPDFLRDALLQLDQDLGADLREYYRTNCPLCGSIAEALYFFWVKEISCPDCSAIVPLMRNFILAKSQASGLDVVVCPKCGEVFETKSSKIAIKCKCDHRFNPQKTSFASKGNYHCPSATCGKKRITDAIEQTGRPKERIYAIEYYCQKCDQEKNSRLKNGRGFKTPDSNDFALFERASKEFHAIKNNLPIPNAPIPVGVDTMRLFKHGYDKFSDMFNERQLLNLGKIYKWIGNVEEWNLKEFLILAFSNSLKYNNMFCKYNGSRGFITDIFRTHSYSPSMAPVEANCYDIPKGRGSFTAFVNLVIEGKEYCMNPFERVFVRDKITKEHFGKPIVGRIVKDYQGIQDEGNVLLQCGTSEQIDVPDKTADAVITDPPYYGNVMYSELSNFFYVWMKIELESRYKQFRGVHAPWRSEVIENRVQKKGEQEFLNKLTDIFSEAGRILKDTGILVFTFHHKEAQAWGAVLQAVLDSGFYVTAIYPVRSEMKASTHIFEMANIEYDMIIVCRKRSGEGKKKSWSSIEATISLTTREVVEDLKRAGERPSEADIFVIALGKCLWQYSMHYPLVMRKGKPMGVSEALESIREIVDAEIAGNRFEKIRSEMDEITAIYLTYIAGRGKGISYSAIDLVLKPRGFDIERIIKHHLIQIDGSLVMILIPLERIEYIKSLGVQKCTVIDKAHYLIALKENDQLISDWQDWTDEQSISALEELAEIEGNQSYHNLAEYLRIKHTQKTLE